MSSHESMIVIAVFGAIAAFTIALAVIAVRLRRADDAAALALRAEQVAEECRDLLVGPDFLWAVWQDTARAAAMKTLIRDARDEVVATVTVPSVPVDGVLKHFECGGRRYEIRKPGLMSSRTCLREEGSDRVLLSTEHTMKSVTFFRGDGESEMFVLPMVSVLKRYRPALQGEQEIGKVIVGLKGNAYAAVVTLPAGRCSMLEQVFIVASL